MALTGNYFLRYNHTVLTLFTELYAIQTDSLSNLRYVYSVDKTMTLLNVTRISDQPSGNSSALKGFRPLLSTVQPLRAAVALPYCSNLGFTLVRMKHVQYVSLPMS